MVVLRDGRVAGERCGSASCPPSDEDACKKSASKQQHRFTQYKPNDAAAICAESNAQADLISTPRHHVRDYAVESEAGKESSQQSEPS